MKRLPRRLGLLAGMAAMLVAIAIPALAGVRADRIQDWLTKLSASTAAAGYRLTWGDVSTSLFGGDVTVKDLRSVDRTGKELFSVAAMTVEELRIDSRPPIAKSLTLEKLRVAGTDTSQLAIRRSSAANRSGVSAVTSGSRHAACTRSTPACRSLLRSMRPTICSSTRAGSV